MMKNIYKILTVLMLTIAIMPFHSILAFADSIDTHENIELARFTEAEVSNNSFLITPLVSSDIDISLFMNIPIFFAEVESGNDRAKDEAMSLIFCRK